MAGGKARLPPRWFVVTAWHVHRLIVRASGRRKGLWPPRPGKWGALRLTTRGRRSGEPRSVILGYYEDGANLVSMAMNGWGAAEPAWWLNLQAHPEAIAELAGGIRQMDVYQIGISFNCNNRDFCGSEDLGGFWGWIEFDHNPATGANTGDAELEGCFHGEFKGAGHMSIEITDWHVAPGDAGPQTFFASGEETDSFRGHRDTFDFTDMDTGIPAVPGHYSTEDVFDFDTPPSVAVQLQVAYKPAH